MQLQQYNFYVTLSLKAEHFYFRLISQNTAEKNLSQHLKDIRSVQTSTVLQVTCFVRVNFSMAALKKTFTG